MSKRTSDSLFYLIKSMSKSEKRYFKLFVAKEGGDKKFVRLFDLIDQQEAYKEEEILRKGPSINPVQISNLKAHLYKRILQSLRMYQNASVKDIEIRELIDHAQILYNRTLYKQCLKILLKAKKLADKNDNLELLLEILKWEKTVMSQTVGKGNIKRVNNIIVQVRDVNSRINLINSFSNLSVKLSSIYMKTGFIRSEKDYKKINNIFNAGLPFYNENELSFLEKLYLYDLLVGYYFFVQDFDKGCKYAKKLVQLFENSKERIPGKLDKYIKGLNSLMIAQYKLMKYYEFVETHKKLKSIRKMPDIELDSNIRLKLLKYTYVHEFNRIFMLGIFDKGVALMDRIKPGLEDFIRQIDNHSRVIMYYKIACLYTGNSDFAEAIRWLNKIINLQEPDLREDVHSFARILNLVCHYELGNTDVIEYYLKSTYRFLLKKDDLFTYHHYILSFMKNLDKRMTEEALLKEFENLRAKLIPLESNPYEKRSFIYFDIISWLESKLQKRPVREVIKEKAAKIIHAQKAV